MPEKAQLCGPHYLASVYPSVGVWQEWVDFRLPAAKATGLIWGRLNLVCCSLGEAGMGAGEWTGPTLRLPQAPTQVLPISPAAPSSLEWRPVSQPDPSYSLSPSGSLKPWLKATDPSTSAPTSGLRGPQHPPLLSLRAKYTLLRKGVVSLP